MVIRNEPKQTILLAMDSICYKWYPIVMGSGCYMVSKPDTRWFANEDAGPKEGGLWDPTSVREGNEACVETSLLKYNIWRIYYNN